MIQINSPQKINYSFHIRWNEICKNFHLSPNLIETNGGAPVIKNSPKAFLHRLRFSFIWSSQPEVNGMTKYNRNPLVWTVAWKILFALEISVNSSTASTSLFPNIQNLMNWLSEDLFAMKKLLPIYPGILFIGFQNMKDRYFEKMTYHSFWGSSLKIEHFFFRITTESF